MRNPLLITITLVSITLSVDLAHAQLRGVATTPRDVNLTFGPGGKVAKVHVRLGQRVREGDLLAELDDTEARARLESARLTAQSDVEVQLARNKVESARVLAERVGKLVESGGATQSELMKRRLDLQSAEAELVKAMQQQQVAKQSLIEARAQLEQTTLRAAFDGVIEAVHVAPGQIVEPNRPIVRLVQTQPLLVDATVPTQRSTGITTGSRCWVMRSGATSGKRYEAKVTHIARVIDPTTDTRQVRVEIIGETDLLVNSHVMLHFKPATDRVADQSSLREE